MHDGILSIYQREYQSMHVNVLSLFELLSGVHGQCNLHVCFDAYVMHVYC